MDKNPYLPGSLDDYIEANLGLARSEAWRFVKRLKRDENIKFDKDDILSIAYLGLLNAYKRFNPTKFTGVGGGEVKFSTYAIPMINGEIRRQIRDLGHTIKDRRDGQCPKNIDSLDRSLNTDENDPITLKDAIQVDNHETDEQMIIGDFLGQVDPRSRKIYKLRALGYSQLEIGRLIGLSQVQVSRMESQLYDLARQYGEGGASVSTNSTKRMREELKTFEQFKAIGTSAVVARHYGVSIVTAHNHKRALVDIDKKMQEKTELGELQNNAAKVTEGGVGTLEDTEGYICPNEDKQSPESVISETEKDEKFANDLIQGYAEETVDDLKGIVEPEPSWNYEAGDGFDLINEDEVWRGIEENLKTLQNLATQKIKNRLLGMLEAI